MTQDFLADAANVACLQALADASAAVVAGMRSNPAAAVAALTSEWRCYLQAKCFCDRFVG